MSETNHPAKRKTNKPSNWAAQNVDDIAAASVVGLIVIGIGVLVKVARDDTKRAIERAEKRSKELNDWENEQRGQGRVLYKLEDGRYLAVEAGSTQVTLIP